MRNLKYECFFIKNDGSMIELNYQADRDENWVYIIPKGTEIPVWSDTEKEPKPVSDLRNNVNNGITNTNITSKSRLAVANLLAGRVVGEDRVSLTQLPFDDETTNRNIIESISEDNTDTMSNNMNTIIDSAGLNMLKLIAESNKEQITLLRGLNNRLNDLETKINNGETGVDTDTQTLIKQITDNHSVEVDRLERIFNAFNFFSERLKSMDVRLMELENKLTKND